MNEHVLPQPQSDRYRIIIKGVMDEDFLQNYCSPGFILSHQHGRTTLSHLKTDQAGMLGLIRQLHNLGVTVLLVELQNEMEQME